MNNFKILLIGTFLFCAVSLNAQEFSEQIAVPLSNPKEPGTLKVNLIKGDIKISAYKGNEVIINASSGDFSSRDECRGCEKFDQKDKKVNTTGMKKISSNPIELSASENNNVVQINSNSWSTRINLEVKLPQNFDLEVSAIHGRLEITGVNGTHEVSSTNGDILITDLGGALISNTVNGDIIATFSSVAADQPMSFVTLKGDLDVTYPASLKATAKMRTERGEIFTDFDMNVDRSRPEVKTEGNEYKVSVNTWVYGSIAGGGPEYTFKTMQGDIVLRKK
ncbi:MAG: DUF4097 family beta strand repeat-containing protein [Bacteroidota bacterium]